ncbi:MAG: alpha/beta fold hydrolase [Candidatus Izemoplasmatales bacterium]
MKHFILNDDFNNDIHTYVYEPKAKPVGVLQIVHGASEHFARYGLFAEYMTKKGYVVVGHDILGHGLSTQTLNFVHFADKKGDQLAFQSLILIKDWILKTYNSLPVYILGHSMGSFLARKMVLEFPKTYDKAIFSGTAYPPKTLLNFGLFLTSVIKWFKGPRYVSKLVQDMSIDSNQKKMRKDGIISGINEEWLTRDKDIQDYYKHSPMCGQPFTVQANHDMFLWIKEANSTKKIKKGNHHQAILFISGGHDPLSEYGDQIHKLVKKMRKMGYNQVEMKIYPEARHEVLNEINRQEVYKDILNFIEK